MLKPVSISVSSISEDQQAGPKVHTILVWRVLTSVGAMILAKSMFPPRNSGPEDSIFVILL